MNSDQFLYSNNFQEYTTPDYSQINYKSSQTNNYENIPYITPIEEDYQIKNNNNIGETTYIIPSIQINQPSINLIEQNNLYKFTNENNQIDSYEDYPVTNYNIPSTNYEQTNNYNLDYSNYNNEINPNIYNPGAQINSTYYSQINSVENNLKPSNIINQSNKVDIIPPTVNINTESNQNIQSSISNQLNEGNQLIQSHPLNKNEEKQINSPELMNPLETKILPPPSIPNLLDLKNENEELKNEDNLEINNILNNEEQNVNLTKDEKLLLKNEKYLTKKNIDIKSHFDLTLIKDENEFFYKKVHKVSTPLLAHYEMPENLEYKNPILSPNQKYIACIGKGEEDSVFVWDTNDLYWYKYKYTYSNVDCISFTPDSKSLIIVFCNSNPIMYDLSSGKTQLEFEYNGEENNRKILQFGFTNKDTHFALTTNKSFTLWSLRTGKIKQRILDQSPIKIISNEYLIFIDSQLNCYIKKISDQSIIENFTIKGIESTEEILDARFTKDMKNFIYVIKHGIIVYNFKKKEFNGLQKFECSVEKVTLSDDGKYIMKTNMKNLCIYDLEKGKNIYTLLKDKFKEYKIYYDLKKLIIIDNISITIQDIIEDKCPNKFIWLNKNPSKFEDVKFSRDFKILLARTNQNEAIAYDLNTGYILKKWENLDENFIKYCITVFAGDKVAIKNNLFSINVWNFSTKKEEASFYGFNSYSMCFSSDGNYLACGTNNGSEIARIWNIPEQKYGIFKYNGTNNNFHTMVHLTSPVPKRLICCAVDQPPLIFNSYNKELLFKCECPYRFEEIYEIQSELRFDIFIIKARDNQKRNIGIVYKISDGTLLNIYENYIVLDLVRFEGIIISKCIGGKLIETDYKNLEKPISIELQVQGDKCKLMNDHRSAVIEYGDEFNKEFNLININNGNFIGKINYLKKTERYCEIYITADYFNNHIYFRYFEFLTPQETMVYLKKNIFNVEEVNA